ncbi:FCD domain-containing protein [Streptomyces sp. SID3343]|uniref:FadR/GntR family transcriptional regulator n=1 Tax=Streptomyces sp. SID3343 TaxID=2690260 RepID=UPI00136BC338|nr:FCD domain-containing protein [Streptomyces sp. SID3343]MYW04648.1 FCD domain-containing protein [Streptomyces sp. SID3343]
MTFGPLRRSPLVGQAAERLRAQIAAGRWPIGSKLPGEIALGKELGIGRSTVREAVRDLAGAGLVESRQGSGIWVIATEPAVDWTTRLRRASAAEVYEVRNLIEVRAAMLAAERRTEEDLDALAAGLAARAAALGDDEAYIDADIAFHARVVAAAHNDVLTDLFAAFQVTMRPGLLDLLAVMDARGLRADRPDPGADAHAAMVAAIRAGDAAEAGRVTEAELAVSLRILRDET